LASLSGQRHAVTRGIGKFGQASEGHWRAASSIFRGQGRIIILSSQIRIYVRIPMKPAIDSETKPATCSDFIPASIPI
jgi:hypothetical protein